MKALRGGAAGLILGILAGWLCLTAIACGGDSDRAGALADLTSEQLAEYDAIIDELGQTAGFELLRPAYLPPGNDWRPSTDYAAHFEEAHLQFFPLERSEPVSERPVISIRQVLDPEEKVCPPCPGRDGSKFEELRLGNTRLLLEGSPHGEAWVFLVIYFRAEDVRLSTRFDWELGPGTPLVVDADMRAEALRVVGSMIEGE